MDSTGLSLLEIYALLLAIGLVLVFVVLVIIMVNSFSIKKRLSELVEKATEEKIPEKAPEETAPVNNKQTGLAQRTRCSMCGNEVREGAIFCDTCGTRM